MAKRVSNNELMLATITIAPKTKASAAVKSL